MSYWRLEPIFESYLIVIAVVVVLAALAMTRPWARDLSWIRRAMLAGIRSLVILLFALAMLRPTLVSQTTKPQASTLLLLADVSRSMQLPSGQSDQTRWQLQREILSSATPGLISLAGEGVEVKAYAFSQQLQSVVIENGELQLPIEPTGQLTDIGSSLHAALRNELGKRLAGVVILSDGVQTAILPEVEIHQAGRELARLGFPLYPIALGKADAASESRDLAIENLQDQYSVFVKNELQVQAGLRARGYLNRPIEVKLILEDQAGKKQVVAAQEVIVRDDNTLTPLQFQYTPPEVGQFQLTVAAQEFDDELVVRNNQLSAFLNVREGGIRVLYVRGNNWFEQKFARRALAESPDVEVIDLLLDPRQRQRWPVDLRETFRKAEFDCIVLDDVDSTALRQRSTPDSNLELLAKAISEGKGLLMVGGYHSFGPGGYQNTQLDALLPITMGKQERQDFTGPLARDLHLAGPLTLQPAASHFITQLAAGNAANRRFWSQLQPTPGANKFAGVKERSQVLLQTSSDEPILVAGEFGRGRVLALATDSTYTWWGQGLASEHKRFWRQMILWLTGRDEQRNDDVWLSFRNDASHPVPGSSFISALNDATGNVLTDVEFDINLTLPDGTQQSLGASRDGESFLASFRGTEQAGRYQITAKATRAGKAIGAAAARFEVFDHDVELTQTAADPGQLTRLAEQTEAAGGRIIAPEQLPELLEEIRQRRDEREITIQTQRRMGDGTADASLLLLLLTCLLSSEWFLRKRWGLV